MYYVDCIYFEFSSSSVFIYILEDINTYTNVIFIIISIICLGLPVTPQALPVLG